MVRLLPHVIARSAERYPDKHAFRCGGQGLSYADLERASDSLARVLVEQGVGRGDRVGLLLPRGLRAPVAIFAVMKAGAAYVPLDPNAPAARSAAMMRSAGVVRLVSDSACATRVTELLALGVELRTIVGLAATELSLDDPAAPELVPWAQVEAAPALAGQVGTISLDLAYIMYTSGSTGLPKGMMHTHASGLSYAKLAAEVYGVNAADRLSNHSPLHFDMSTFDYFAGPLAGATTVIIPEAHAKLPASLSKLIEDEKLTIWYSVPFALIQLLTRGVLERRDLSSLRWVLFGGEHFSPKHLRALMKRWPQARFSNVYGPAEVNQCTHYHVPPSYADSEEDGPLPIGEVWAEAEGRVLDVDGRAVAPGEVGELVVRTSTMMAGYFGRPDLDERGFLDEQGPGGQLHRFYRTGDLVRARADGQLVLVGRRDRLVKIRGHRVELDEVEAALGACPGVVEAATYASMSDDGVSAVHAAVKLGEGERPTSAQLIAQLAEQLPAYALPTRLAFVEEFPRTASGKIDRTRLREGAQD